MKRFVRCAAVAALLSGCGGGSNVPFGSAVNSPGGSGPPPTQLVPVSVTVTIPAAGYGAGRAYVSPNTESLVVQLVAVDGNGVTGTDPTVIETRAGSHGCTAGRDVTVCSARTSGSPGNDEFAVSAYAGRDATGAVLSVGSVEAKIARSGSRLAISNRLSLALAGVIASVKVTLSPNEAKRGVRAAASIALRAYDASGAEIVGPSDYSEPIVLAIEGNVRDAFALRRGGASGQSLDIARPAANLTLRYDGNAQAQAVTVAATVEGPSSIGASAGFALRGKQPPPPVGEIYVLNLGKNDGAGATVTEYDGKSGGNAKPRDTLELSTKLYARAIAVDASGNLYVGYLDNELGFSAQTGEPDSGNEIAVYAPGAGGNAQPKALLQSDEQTESALFPIFIAFDPSGRLVTYGATDVDANTGNAVLTYAAKSTGRTSPEYAWSFASPQLRYGGPTGLALDGAGNFYVNGALHTPLGPDDGVFVNAAADIGDPSAEPARTIPWDSKTELEPGLTTGVALATSGEVLVGNAVSQGSGSKTSCQARVNVYAAGASGGTTDDPPLRTLTFDGIATGSYDCTSSRNPLLGFFPAFALYGSSLFVADDYNDAVAEFSANGHGIVKPLLRIAGSATGLDVPVALVITTASGQAKAGPVTGAPAPDVSPLHALHAR